MAAKNSFCAEEGRGKSRGEEFDLVVVGGGSAAFAAAVRAAELGARAAIVERGALGGTCVNVGCVPSKTLVRAAQARHRAGHHGFEGIATRAEETDLQAVAHHKRELVSDLQRAKYIDVLAAYPAIRTIDGEARMHPSGAIEVGGEIISAKEILLATGASPRLAPIPGLAEAGPLTSAELMELESLPEHLVVVGGGYVGVELGQTFARLGSRVTLLSRSPILRREEPALSAALAGYLRGEGIDVREEVPIARVSGRPGAFRIDLGEGDTIVADHILAATGRRPNTAGVGLEEAGVDLGSAGEIAVDRHLRTSLPGVYAAGDVIGEPAFVNVAAYAGTTAAENALRGDPLECDLSVVPRVTFSDPALAAVGLTESEARGRGLAVATAALEMRHVPRAIAARDTRGAIVLVADASSRKLVGAHILAPEAGDIIQQAAMAIRFGIRVDEIASMLHPYLTSAEALKLACQSFDKDIAKLSCCAV